VRALAAALGDAAIDLVFNVAGVHGGPGQSIRQMADDLALGDVAATYDVNAIGALRVSLALLSHLRRGATRKLVHVSSSMGSIADNRSGGYYAYRMSKAALNMRSRSLAADLRDEGIASVVINPGWLQTDMGGPGAPTPVADGVRAVLHEVDLVSHRAWAHTRRATLGRGRGAWSCAGFGPRRTIARRRKPWMTRDGCRRRTICALRSSKRSRSAPCSMTMIWRRRSAPT
jgi:NAD(P)-dependent dehydrogenase (short-subunit alcohol dehydrogenase family)